jgi:hypothetical protein
LGVPGVEKIKGPDPRIGDQAAPGGAGDGGNARADGRRRFDADGFDAGTDGAERKARFPTAIEHRFGLGVRVVAPGGGDDFLKPCGTAMGRRAGSAQKAHGGACRLGGGKRAQCMAEIVNDDGGRSRQGFLANFRQGRVFVRDYPL